MERNHGMNIEVEQPDSPEDENTEKTSRERWEEMRTGHETEDVTIGPAKEPPVEASLNHPLEIEDDFPPEIPEVKVPEIEDDFPLEAPEVSLPEVEDDFPPEMPDEPSEETEEKTDADGIFDEMSNYGKRYKENADNPEEQRSILVEIGKKVQSALKELDKEKELEEKLKNNSLSAREIADNYDFLQSKGFSITPKELLDKYEQEQKKDKSLPPVFE